jgi:hypothetical protein
MALICQHKLSAPLNKSRRHARRNFLILNSQENSRSSENGDFDSYRSQSTDGHTGLAEIVIDRIRTA